MTPITSVAGIVDGIHSLGMGILAIMLAVLGVGLGFFLFRYGYKTIMNLPGGWKYDSSRGSGLSRWSPRKNVRSKTGSINLMD